MARLSHPNLVHLLDRGEDAEGPYLVMELVDGREPEEPHAARGCARRPTRPRASARGSADALALRARAGRGAPRHQGPERAAHPRRHREAGRLRHRPAHRVGGRRGPHRAPTCCSAAPTTCRRSRPTAGRSTRAPTSTRSASCSTSASPAVLPFRGEGFVAVAMKHCSEPLPDPRLARPACPTASRPCAMRAAAKEPADRFPDAEAMVAALEGRDGRHRRLRPAAGARPRTRATPPAAGGPGAGGRLMWGLLLRAPGRGRRRWRPASRSSRSRTRSPPPGRRGGARSRSRRCATTTPRATTRRRSPRARLRDRRRPNGRQPGHRLVHRALPGHPGVRRPGKTGVGLILRLTAPAVATEMVVSSPTPGAAFQVLGPLVAGQRQVLGPGRFGPASQVVKLRPPRRRPRRTCSGSPRSSPDERGRLLGRRGAGGAAGDAEHD